MTGLQPSLYPNHAIVPLLVAAILLQYAPQEHTRHYLVACTIATIAIVILGETLPDTSHLPAGLLGFMRTSSMVATVGFTLLLLWQFGSRLSMIVERVRTTNDALEAQNAEMTQANQVIIAQLDEQQRLLDLVNTLEMPVIRLADQVLFVPVVGHMDSRRAGMMTVRLLQTVHSDRARHVILDLSGLTVMDTTVAQSLGKAIQSMQLLGCHVTLSGISSALAVTITQLGLDLGRVAIARSPQEALQSLALAQ